jgi:hypothetical protein
LNPCGESPCESLILGGTSYYFCNCGDDNIVFNQPCPSKTPICNPICQNRGECVVTGNSGQAKCQCPILYTGEACENFAVPLQCADSVNCQNGGTCRNEADGFVCDCTSQYTGTFCEQIQRMSLIFTFQYHFKNIFSSLGDICIRDKPCGDYKCEWLPSFIVQTSYICFCENNFLVLNRNCTNARK